MTAVATSHQLFYNLRLGGTCLMGPFIKYVRTEDVGGGGMVKRMPIFSCHSDAIISEYRVSGWVWNLYICAYVLNEWTLMGMSHQADERIEYTMLAKAIWWMQNSDTG